MQLENVLHFGLAMPLSSLEAPGIDSQRKGTLEVFLHKGQTCDYIALWLAHQNFSTICGTALRKETGYGGRQKSGSPIPCLYLFFVL